MEPPENNTSWWSLQTTRIQVFGVVVLGVLIAVVYRGFHIPLIVLYDISGSNITVAHISDANLPHESIAFSSAHAQRGPIGIKWTRKTVKSTTTRKPTSRSSQSTTEHTIESSLAMTVMSKRNDSVEPCENFYHHAMGQFLLDIQCPDGKVQINAFMEVDDLRQAQLRSILKEKKYKNETTLFELPAYLYQMCMDKPRIERQGIQQLLDNLEALGGWPVLKGDNWNKDDSWSWSNMLKDLRRLGYSTNYFFDVSVGVDLKHNSRRIIYIDHPTLSINREYLIKGHPKLSEYINYTTNMALLLGADVERAKRDFLALVDFEVALAKFSLPNEDRQYGADNPVSLRVFQDYYNYTDWVDLFNTLFMDTGVKIDENEMIILLNPSFMKTLSKLLPHSKKRILANYAMQRVINYSASFLPGALQKLQQKYSTVLCDKNTGDYRCLDITAESVAVPRDLFYINKTIDFAYTLYNKKVWGQYDLTVDTAEEQKQRCSDFTTNRLPIAVGALYVRKYFNDVSRRAVLDMAIEIKSAFGEILRKVDWMSETTRESALEKLNSMVFHIGYPDELMDDKILTEYYRDLEFKPKDNYLGTVLRIDRFITTKNFEKLHQTVNKTDWTTHSKQTAVDAFYSPTENSIQIPASYFQGPLYSNDWPKYMNYGAIGVVIGREITRGFYGQGQHFDKSGNPVDWWEIGTNKVFHRKTVCVREAFWYYQMQDPMFKVDGYDTFIENIADMGGIKAAHYAYKKWAEKNGPEPPLPDLELTPEQMFWLLAAQSWYSLFRPNAYFMLFLTNDVSPAPYRVLVTMSNMIEFSEDFHCPSESPMNPTGKCEVW